MNTLRHFRSKVPPRLIPMVRAAFSILAGVAAAAVFSYVLYRLGMPSKPFIYVSF
jgi:hypothetical protein